MVRYYRRRYPRRYYRRRYPRRYRRYARKYVNASSRSSLRIKTNITKSFTKTSGYGSTLGAVASISPFSGGEDALAGSPLYNNYCNLYEECKLIGMKIAVAVITPVGATNLPSLQIYTCFDRRHGYGEPHPTADEIRNMASMTCATALNNNVAKLTRSIYASDLLEKAQWVDTDPVSSANLANQAWVTAGRNPNFFCPSFHMCFGSPSLTQDNQANVNFSLSITYYVAFRNPKFGGSASAKDLPTKQVTMATSDDVDFDDDIGDMEPETRATVVGGVRKDRPVRVPVTAPLTDEEWREKRRAKKNA